MANGIKITSVDIRNFGDIASFKCALKDRVYIDNDYDKTDIISDFVLVLRHFLGMDMYIKSMYDITDDSIATFDSKMRKSTYIEIGFVFNDHDFVYHYSMDDMGKRERYIRDIVSGFTITGKLLYEFTAYMMNAYHMSLCSIDNLSINLLEHTIGDGDFDDIWYALLNYEPIDDVNGIFDFTSSDYDKVVERAIDRYGQGVMLLDNLCVMLEKDGLVAYVDGVRVDNFDRYHSKYDVAFMFFKCVVTAYLIGQVLAIENENLASPPMLIDATLVDNNWLDFEEVIGLLHAILFTLDSQIILVDGNFIVRLLSENVSTSDATYIYANDGGLFASTRMNIDINNDLL